MSAESIITVVAFVIIGLLALFVEDIPLKWFTGRSPGKNDQDQDREAP